MNPLLDKYLCDTYPHVFADRRLDMTQSSMCRGFECGDGWFWIIKEAAAQLEQLILNYVKRVDFQFRPRASQVKEKFGTLRFYLTAGTDAMHYVTEEAERKSGKTCEVCGRPGKLRGGLWVRTTCQDHADQRSTGVFVSTQVGKSKGRKK